jgi:hypothetical protein
VDKGEKMSEQKTNEPMTLGVMNVARVPNPSRPTFYANNTVVMANQWDLQLNFGLIHETIPGQFGSLDEVLIIMTPEHALALSNALQGALQAYSASQGEIRKIKSPEISTPEKSS